MDAAGGGAEFRFIPAICCVRVAIGGGGGIFPYEDGANPGCCVDGGAETGGAEKPPGGRRRCGAGHTLLFRSKEGIAHRLKME